MTSAPLEWHLRDRILWPGNPALVMGIVNVTPDSFSDGGCYFDAEAAIAHGVELVRQGAALLDVGGESSRPGSLPISAEEEAARILPVLRGLAQRTGVPLSVDTCKAEVARRALEAGAHIVNDITALSGDANMAEVVRRHRAGLILMHMQGTPATMQVNPTYDDVTAEVVAFLEARLQAAEDLGIASSQVVLDPGIGFGKTAEHNLALLARLDLLCKLGRPVCLGVSRKGFLGRLLDRPVPERLAGSLAVACHALVHGSAHILRVHDVAPTCDAVRVLEALSQESGIRSQESAREAAMRSLRRTAPS
jgi:dihydropteroate synthase